MIDRQNGAAVAEGSSVDVLVVEEASMIEERERLPDEVSGLVTALGGVNVNVDVNPRDNEAAVGKRSHVAPELIPGLIEEVDEDVAMDDVATAIIDSCTNAKAAAITGIFGPSHDESAVGQSSNVREGIVYT